MEIKFAKKFSLAGKVAVITGASGMLGKKHTLALLELGAFVVMTDIDMKSLEEAKEQVKGNFPASEIEIFSMDVTSEESVGRIYEKLQSMGLRVDILINNAAINPTSSSLVVMYELHGWKIFRLDRWNRS